MHIRPWILAGVFFLGAIWGVYAQRKDFTHSSYYVGGGGGVGVAMMQFSPSVSQSLLKTSTFFLDFRYSNRKYTEFHTRVAYQQRGWQESANSSESSVPSYSRLSQYVDWAVWTTLYWPLRQWKVGIDLGPQVGYRLSSDTSKGTNEVSESQAMRYSLDPEHPIAWGLSVSPFVAWQISPHLRWEVALQGYYALGDFFASTLTSPYARSAEMAFYGTTTLYFTF